MTCKVTKFVAGALIVAVIGGLYFWHRSRTTYDMVGIRLDLRGTRYELTIDSLAREVSLTLQWTNNNVAFAGSRAAGTTILHRSAKMAPSAVAGIGDILRSLSEFQVCGIGYN